MLQLRAELHSHCQGDPVDSFLNYSAKDLIDAAAAKGFEILAISCHDHVAHTAELAEYALEKDILLIPAVERTIKGKHVLIYNVSWDDVVSITSFEDLVALKNRKRSLGEEILIIAAHPYHPGGTCAGDVILQFPDLFDAWEYSYFYSSWWNPNRKTQRLARRYDKPLVANSDVHDLRYLGSSSTVISCSEKSVSSVFAAIRQGNLTLRTKPLAWKDFIHITRWVLWGNVKKIFSS